MSYRDYKAAYATLAEHYWQLGANVKINYGQAVMGQRITHTRPQELCVWAVGMHTVVKQSLTSIDNWLSLSIHDELQAPR